jgi:hypothetical protein
MKFNTSEIFAQALLLFRLQPRIRHSLIHKTEVSLSHDTGAVLGQDKSEKFGKVKFLLYERYDQLQREKS